MDVRGHTALVTGASRGIGRALALALAERGAHVVACARTEAQLRELAAEAPDGSIVPLPFDLRGNVGEAFGHSLHAALGVSAAMGGSESVSLFLHAAASFAPFGPIETVSPSERRMVFAVHATAFLDLCGLLLPEMKERRFGRIVALGSVAASLGAHGQAAYASAKSALSGAVRSLALEGGRYGVTCNLLELGLIDTQRIREVLSDERRKALCDGSAVGRIGTLEEAVHAALFLASPASGFVTGTTLRASGGLELGLPRFPDAEGRNGA